MNKFFNKGLFRYKRRKSHTVNIGDSGIGGNNPIRIQSMTTTDTMDTKSTVDQTIRMVNSGCEFVRITAPSVGAAKNLSNIKNELRMQGYNVPLIADIHFTPKAAEISAEIVEKVRINPGNYSDTKKFKIIEYDDNRRKNRTWYLPIKNNEFIMFPATQRYMITENTSDKLNTILVINYEYI